MHLPVTRQPIPLRLWVMLAAMVVAQAATTVVSAAPAFLIPHMLEREGMSLAAAGLPGRGVDSRQQQAVQRRRC